MKEENPLYSYWNTPFGLPPFDRIKPGHFLPAIRKAIKDALEEISLIASESDKPGFDNTIAALEQCGRKVDDIASLLFNLNMAETNEEIQAMAQKVSSLLTRFSNQITLNPELYDRIRKASETGDSINGSREKQMLAEKKLRAFRMGGAGLNEKDKQEFREVTEELSGLTLRFEENILAETNGYDLQIINRNDLAGLPDTIIDSAAEEANKRDKEGWVFTLHQPSFGPFMQYADNRELRKRLFIAYSSRCFRNNRHNNTELVKRIVNLRLRLSNLLGYKRYSDMILEEMMAGSTERVKSFLEELHKASFPAARKDYSELRSFAKENGHTGDFERWDWAYWSEKLKMKKFSIDDELLRPYFRLDMVEDAIFRLAGTLYGIKFRLLVDAHAYHNEVRVFEVTENNGTHLGILMTDYHPRPGKSGGAWMTNFREQFKTPGGEVRPVISIVTNFSRPSGNKPALLTHNELTTFLHEFGHAMHGMLTKCTYATLSGTNVARDFVELPSQIMENWAYEMEWLDTWATHYKTGKKIPGSIIEKIRQLAIFNEGYACNRQLGFGFLDMAWHTIENEFRGDIATFEKNILEPVQLFGVPEGTNLSCAFGHLFSGGYASGYYGYKWAEVLDADAFSQFRENGITSKEVAAAFRENILEKGATEKPSILYSGFRGAEPSIEPLLVRSGFKKE